ncbi:methyltransferase [Brachybacterium ginsengisoli]|uniref:Methyltransferase n=1 Tax=Brachybacterium ginsengisoli TaxID=1331682 RepID=A0A291GYB7_9MICO|nr:class I SAM-dependent methyltransferase [Brachybacterium ginsengisoli]ATG55221.1 methyltransferase [Brachybacterium ginsengisoli]
MTFSAYSARAQEYADLLGSMEAMSPTDERTILDWAGTVRGPLLDAGCGPGHWTAHLAARGHDARGMDPVPEFVEIAQRAHPGIPYSLGTFADLAQRPGSWGGILAWYSLIHLEPSAVPETLATLHDALAPGGALLMGFFDGPRQEAFDHAVAPAQHWPLDLISELVEQAGFEVLDSQRRQDPGSRPHGAISARRR